MPADGGRGAIVIHHCTEEEEKGDELGYAN
jgi:hypothetical protein